MTKARRNVSNYLLFFQSLADSYIGFVMCFEVMSHYLIRYEYWHDRFLLTYTGMLEYSFTLSLGILFLCVTERYLSVNNPIYHKQKVTKLRTIGGSILVCVSAMIPPLCLLSLMNFQLENSSSTEVTIYSLSFNAAIFGLVVSVVVILTMTLENARAAIQPKAADTLPLNEYRAKIRTNTARTRKRKEYRLIKIFIVMIIAYIFSYIPITILRFLYDIKALDNFDAYQDMVVITLCQTLYKSSALFNPILTILLKRDYRKKLQHSIKQRKSFSSGFESQKFYIFTTYV